MGMKTIAEFVENDQIKSMLADIDVDFIQCYGIGKPELFNEDISQFNLLTKTAALIASKMGSSQPICSLWE